jgi:signal transduction histidine kinase
VGQISTILMALSAMYAIIKHRLFSIRIIATELLIFLLWIILLVRLLLGQTLTDHIVNSTSFILTIIAGVFLIRSVIKEISQREKIEILASDLETSNKHLVDLNKQKSEFVSFATHQLRAPLTAMKGYASLLLEGDMGKLEPESRVGISRIFEASKTLASIVEDYLNLTRIELGSMKYAFDAVDLRLLIENVLAELKPSIDEKTEVKFTYDYERIGSTYRITADKEKLKQVISNIIDNALKYTPSGKVSVYLGFDRSKHRFILTVEDTGIGISKDILPRLFMKFSRADNANMTNIKGTGLGLYVAREIMNAHGGTIDAKSEGEGKGSKFILEFEPLVTA